MDDYKILIDRAKKDLDSANKRVNALYDKYNVHNYEELLASNAPNIVKYYWSKKNEDALKSSYERYSKLKYSNQASYNDFNDDNINSIYNDWMNKLNEIASETAFNTNFNPLSYQWGTGSSGLEEGLKKYIESIFGDIELFDIARDGYFMLESGFGEEEVKDFIKNYGKKRIDEISNELDLYNKALEKEKEGKLTYRNYSYKNRAMTSIEKVGNAYKSEIIGKSEFDKRRKIVKNKVKK